MSKILGLRTTIYRVSDLEAATSWYEKAFETSPYFKEPFYVGFNIAGYELGLLPHESDGPVVTGENVITYWGVEDIEVEYERFLTLGAVDFTKPANVGGEIMTGELKDPWGNLIGLIYNPEFKL